MKRKRFEYSGITIAKELNMSPSKFIELVNAGIFDFVTITEGKNFKKRYHYDIVKVKEYINAYKREVLEEETLNKQLKTLISFEKDKKKNKLEELKREINKLEKNL